MKTFKTFWGTTALAVVGLIAPMAQTSAVPIDGEITFSGLVNLKKNGGASSATLTDATYLEFSNPVGILSTSGTFDLISSTVPNDVNATLTPLDLNSFSGPLTLWVTQPNGYFTFVLETLSYTRVDLPVDGVIDALVIGGTGYATSTLPDLEQTPGYFEFSAQGRGKVTVAFSATTTVAPPPSVPDAGSTFMLLGLAVSGLGAARKVIPGVA